MFKTTAELHQQFALFPKELKQMPNWVIWKRMPRNNGKTAKVPYCPATKKPAKSNDPSTWSSFEQALENCQGFFNGIGFMFPLDGSIVGIDVDNKKGGSIFESRTYTPEMLTVLGTVNSYAEISPSGKGIHVFIKAHIPKGEMNKPTNATEIYQKGRFFTVTGWQIPKTPNDLQSQQTQLDNLYKRLNPTGDKSQNTRLNPIHQKNPAAQGNNTYPVTSNTIFQRARNDAKFNALFAGNLFTYGDDQSRADLGLCLKLAFYTQGNGQLVDA